MHKIHNDRSWVYTFHDNFFRNNDSLLVCILLYLFVFILDIPLTPFSVSFIHLYIYRAWYHPGLVPLHFRARHAMLTMHVWFLHRRLILDPTQPTFSLGVQEELFDMFWNDTKARIRAEQLNEMTVYSHLKKVQQYTMLHMTHYDHAFTSLQQDPPKRLEELMKAIYIHVFGQNPQVPDEILHRMAVYLEYQLETIVFSLPDEYFFEGRIAWGNVPEFPPTWNGEWSSKDEQDRWKANYDLPLNWKRVGTDKGEYYYWNTVTHETTWNRPATNHHHSVEAVK